MDDDQRGFLRNLLHGVLQAALYGLIWRLPTWAMVLLVIVLLGVIWKFGLF